jgi:hypothetical protein
MNEPLNKSLTSVNFSGKSHNLYLHWHNQPLRLTSEQTQKPETVLDDFFQCYHLHEVREILWQWLTEAVSSPNSHSGDHHERNNYMFFYEKMETLVEAAWIMKRGTGQVTNLARQAPEKEKSEPSETSKKAGEASRFSKPARLIEKVAADPAAVINEVFSHPPFDELHGYLLPNWLRVALINNMSPYTAAIDREILYEFYDQLLLFVEAVYCNSQTVQHYSPAYLTEEQLADPSVVITAFFQQFSMDYIRRELADFLDAGIGYDGNYPNGFTPWQAWMTYNHLCLTEATYRLHMDQQKQAVLDAHAELMMELEEVV